MDRHGRYNHLCDLRCQPQNRPHFSMNSNARGSSSLHFSDVTTRSSASPGVEGRNRGTLMRKWSKTISEEGSVDAMARLREQDDKFCQTLRAAIERGREFCPTVVSTVPGTQRPILGYTRPE
jgi:hypothetical protein